MTKRERIKAAVAVLKQDPNYEHWRASPTEGVDVLGFLLGDGEHEISLVFTAVLDYGLIKGKKLPRRLPRDSEGNRIAKALVRGAAEVLANHWWGGPVRYDVVWVNEGGIYHVRDAVTKRRALPIRRELIAEARAALDSL